jgi:serine/threonine protein kinase
MFIAEEEHDCTLYHLRWSHSGFYTNLDIWSLGCILFELTARRPAFKNSYDIYTFRDSKSNDPLGFRTFDDGMYISPFVVKILQIDPSERPSASALLELFSSALDGIDANR